VKTALSAGIAANFTTDTSIDMTEFDVQFNNNTLTIKNSSGRALKIENFESYAGTMTVSSLNEIGTSEELASQNRLFSELRIAVNPSGFGKDFGSAAMRFSMDGRSVAGTFAVDFNGTANQSLSSLASVIETDLRAMTDLSAVWGTADLGWAHDMSLIEVDYDLDTNELIIRHPDGEALAVGLSSSGTALFDTGALFVNNFSSSIANKSNAVNASSEVIQGAVLEATRVKMTLNEDIASFGFTINGVTVSNTLYDATERLPGRRSKLR
jgi:hypothetical protein